MVTVTFYTIAFCYFFYGIANVLFRRQIKKKDAMHCLFTFLERNIEVKLLEFLFLIREEIGFFY
jgi:hypothetical protein